MSLQRDAAIAVAEWITEALGDEAAHTWVWECTPMPCWLPSDEQIQEGLSVALGELSIGDLVAKCYREMDEQMAAYRAAQSESPAGGDAP